MGELILVMLAAAASLGFYASVQFYVYGWVTVPSLARRGGRRVAYALLAIPLAALLAVAVAIGIAHLDVEPRLQVILLVGVSVAASMTYRLVGPVIDLSGGPRTDRPLSEIQLAAHLDEAEYGFQRGDDEHWVEELRQAAQLEVRGADGVRAAARELIATGGSRDGTAILGAHRRLRREAARLWRGPHQLRWLAAAGGAASFLVLLLPIAAGSYAARRACIEAEPLLASATGVMASMEPLTAALPRMPEAGATLTFDAPMDLAETADSRHDPETLGQLTEAGFVAAHARQWTAADGRVIQADVMQFGDTTGALAYQARVTRYACGFSNLAFGAPQEGIGLQVRWSRGDPIVEQISWVASARRFLVSVRLGAPPADHARILGIRATVP